MCTCLTDIFILKHAILILCAQWHHSQAIIYVANNVLLLKEKSKVRVKERFGCQMPRQQEGFDSRSTGWRGKSQLLLCVMFPHERGKTGPLLQFQLLPLQPGCFFLNCDTRLRSKDVILQTESSTRKGLSGYLGFSDTQHSGGSRETMAWGQCKQSYKQLHSCRKTTLKSLIALTVPMTARVKVYLNSNTALATWDNFPGTFTSRVYFRWSEKTTSAVKCFSFAAIRYFFYSKHTFLSADRAKWPANLITASA